MNGYLSRMGAFFRNLRKCMAAARKDCDTWYHIPKSRFNGGPEERGQLDYLSEPAETPPKNAFLGSFRDCFVKAWKDSDDHYYLPKRRFTDAEYNRSAYRTTTEQGFWSALFVFPARLMSCITMAWKASDILYYLPKSGYQDREYVTSLMNAVPKPRGKVVIRPFRPITLEVGVVGGDGLQEGWTVGLADKGPDQDFFLPDEIVESRGKPEIEI